MKQPKIKIEAIPFDGWEDAALNPPLTTAETKTAECEQSAKREESLNRPERADSYREKARNWQKFADFTETDFQQSDWTRWEELIDAVDFQLVRGQESMHATLTLSMVIDHALQGLHALAAHGNKPAASLLIKSLAKAANNFELLAYHKPELFRSITRKHLSIPVTISPRSGRAKQLIELCEKLEVGNEGLFAITRKGKGNRWSTANEANLLAIRLVNYIDQFSWQSKTFAKHLEIYEETPEWFLSLATLEPFSNVTWQAWAEVAWKIIKSISPEGKPEKHPPITKIFKVRKGAGNDDATARADIKEALRGAFETIATGVSPRTRQRRAKTPRQKRK